MHSPDVKAHSRGTIGKYSNIRNAKINSKNGQLPCMMNYSFGNQVITVSTFQGNPPFEKPSIAKGVTNFVLFKFGHLPQKDWQTMYDLAKMFLHCLNHWKLETPTARKQLMSSDDISAYKVSTSLYDTNLRNLVMKY